jgi:asparagine synthase (glutamine-hydrolysing)
MTDGLWRRGPDGRGVWVSDSGCAGLGHRRLSIIDLSPLGAQPMSSGNGRFTMVYNGEIYNFQDLRRQLEAAGFAFRGHSDTEVLLAACERWGIEQALARIAGMFAIALWDNQLQTLHLARDRMGIKPLYYGVFEGRLAFASELRPIVTWLGRLPEVSVSSLALYLRLGYIPSPRSIFEEVRKLPPGTYAVFRNGALDPPRTFWRLEDALRTGLAAPVGGTDNDALDGLEKVLSECLRQHMIADVPLGAFLSGGIDSSTVVALMQSLATKPVRTFSIGFRESGYDEARHAAAVARHLGTDHTEFYVTEREAQELVPELPDTYDEPFADASQIPTMIVSRLARSSVTVSLSGDGGDELFAGYNRYLFVSRFWKRLARIPRFVRRGLASFLAGISPENWDRGFDWFGHLLPGSLRPALPGQKMHKIGAILGGVSLWDAHWRLVAQWPVPEGVIAAEHRPGIGSSIPSLTFTGGRDLHPVLQQIIWDVQTYLADDILTKVDRASMRYGLEARVPFLDHRVVEYALSLPLSMKVRNGSGKWLLRHLLHRYVPKELVDRPKMGFSVPVDSWLRGPLCEWGAELLSPPALSAHGLFEEKVIRQTWEAHIAGTADRSGPLWVALMFQAWWERAQTWV